MAARERFSDLHVVQGPRPLTWRLTDRLVYESPRLGTIIVPAGFVTDLDSTPRRTRTAFALLYGTAPRAAVIHDWLYWGQRVGTRQVSREEADLELYASVIDEGAAPWRALLFWVGVRLGGWVAWRARRKG